MNAIAPDPYPNRYTPEGRAQIKRDTADLKHLRDTEPRVRIVCEPVTLATPAEAESEIFDHLNECQAAGIVVYKKDFRIRLATA